MPQMSPLMWLPLMVVFNASLIMIMTLTFTSLHKTLNMNSKIKKKTNPNIKW